MGDIVGAIVGDTVGDVVGDALEKADGKAVGEVVGAPVGEAVGRIVGTAVGECVGARAQIVSVVIVEGITSCSDRYISLVRPRQEPNMRHELSDTLNCEVKSQLCSLFHDIVASQVHG